MAKVQGFRVVKDGLVSLSDVYGITPMQQGIEGLGNFMFPPVGGIFTSNNAVETEFKKSYMSGELRRLIEEGAIEPIELEGTEGNLPEFNAKNKPATQDLNNLSIQQLEEILEEKKRASLIQQIAETQVQEPVKDKMLATQKDSAEATETVKEEIQEKTVVSTADPLLKDFTGLSYQEKLTYISKATDKAVLKAIVSSDEEISVVKKRALDKLAK